MRTLVTGASGFTAHYLIDLLAADPGCELYLTDCAGRSPGNIIRCDLARKAHVEKLIGRVKPERVYNLAGTFTNDYDIDYSANVLGAKNIMDAMLKYGLSGRILLVGSCAEYGFIKEKDNPVGEGHPLRPCQVYGVTKAYQTVLMSYYHRVYGMDIVMARTFNLSGCDLRISRLMFAGRVRDQIEKVKKGKTSNITTGSLESKRDYIDVREAVRYYRAIMENGSSGEIYNVGSGRAVRMRTILADILKDNGLSMKIVKEKKDLYSGKADIPRICADTRKIKRLLRGRHDAN